MIDNKFFQSLVRTLTIYLGDQAHKNLGMLESAAGHVHGAHLRRHRFIFR